MLCDKLIQNKKRKQFQILNVRQFPAKFTCVRQADLSNDVRAFDCDQGIVDYYRYCGFFLSHLFGHTCAKKVANFRDRPSTMNSLFQLI